MEFWINTIESVDNNGSNILTMQLKRAMCSLDIYLETEAIRLSSPTEVKSEKAFLKVFRGRLRSRPYKVVQSGGSDIYTQI